MTPERLQKLLARAGVASRRNAEQLIRDGRVSVNGRVASIGDRAQPERDVIRVDGKRIRLPAAYRYLLVNKPRAVVTTRSDPEGRRTVFDLLPLRLRKGLVAAGRLDYDSEGLLILTDDGDLVHAITHPRHGCVKTYAVKVKGTPTEAEIERVRQGMMIEGRRTAPASVRSRRRPRASRGQKNSWWTMRLVEGRNRQIREMFFRIGHPVQRLIRIAIGDLSDARLGSGEFRPLRSTEVERLRSGREHLPARSSAPGSGSGRPNGGRA